MIKPKLVFYMCFKQSVIFLQFVLVVLNRSADNILSTICVCALWDSIWFENMCLVYLSSGTFFGFGMSGERVVDGVQSCNNTYPM